MDYSYFTDNPPAYNWPSVITPLQKVPVTFAYGATKCMSNSADHIKPDELKVVASEPYTSTIERECETTSKASIYYIEVVLGLYTTVKPEIFVDSL